MGSSFGWQILRKRHKQFFRTRANARVHKPENTKAKNIQLRTTHRTFLLLVVENFVKKMMSMIFFYLLPFLILILLSMAAHRFSVQRFAVNSFVR